jgi:hypothetical protein
MRHQLTEIYLNRLLSQKELPQLSRLVVAAQLWLLGLQQLTVIIQT